MESSIIVVTAKSMDFVESIFNLLSEGKKEGFHNRLEEQFVDLSLDEAEHEFLRFDASLQSMLEASAISEDNKPAISGILQLIMEQPAEFATNRFTKRLFRRLVDWAAAGGNTTLATEAHPKAVELGCYDY